MSGAQNADSSTAVQIFRNAHIHRGVYRKLKMKNEPVDFLAQGRFFNANDLSHSGGCGTRGFCSNKNHSNILAVPVLSLRSTGISGILKLHWLKSTFARNIAKFIFIILA